MTAQQKYCKRCAHAVASSLRFCPQCGHGDFQATLPTKGSNAAVPASPPTAVAPLPPSAPSAPSAPPASPRPLPGASLPPVRTAAPVAAVPVATPGGRLARSQIRMLKPWAVGLLVVAVLGVGGAMFGVGGRIADWRVDNTTVAEERAMADATLREIAGQASFLATTHAEHQLVERLGRRLVAVIPGGSRYSYRFHVIDEASINAFALPGGDVVVHRGLLRLLDRVEQLAAVLAHEIQHVEQQHGIRGYFHTQSAATIIAWTFGLASPDGTELAVYLKHAKYGRALETDADLRGAQLLTQAGVDRAHMVTLLRKLAQAPGSRVPAWLSDHPDPLDRARRVEAAR